MLLSWDNSLSLGVQLANSLRIKIVAGELTNTQKLSENVIAKEYGLSRAPVREALRILETEGLVHLTKQGILIQALTEKDLQEFYDVRFMLETFAFTHLPQDEVSALTEQLDAYADRMELAIVHRDFEEFAAQDMKFHDLIFEKLQHRFIKLFWENIKNLARAILYVGTKRRFEQQEYQQDMQSAKNHRDITKALRSCDAEQLRQALLMHFTYYNGWIVKDRF